MECATSASAPEPGHAHASLVEGNAYHAECPLQPLGSSTCGGEAILNAFAAIDSVGGEQRAASAFGDLGVSPVNMNGGSRLITPPPPSLVPPLAPSFIFQSRSDEIVKL